MPGVVTVDLAVAVAEAGGLAMLPGAAVPPPVLVRRLDDFRSRTAAPYGVNFLIPFLDEEALAVAASRARIVEFFYGQPEARLVDVVHAGGALACWQVGSAAEAMAAERAGCDLVVAQGVEAGGHVRGTTGLVALLPQVLDAVGVPVVAAGGIATARAMASALAAGADGVRVGTRFVASAESGAHPSYVDALVAAGSDDTVLTEAFSVWWPNAPHRVLRSCVEAAARLEEETAGQTLVEGVAMPIPRWSVPVPDRHTTGSVGAMALYAGQSVAAITDVQPAASIVRDLCDGAERLLAAHA